MSDDTDVPMPTESTDTDPPATDPPSKGKTELAGLKFSSVTQRWRLNGPAGPGLDLLVANFILMGFPVEAIAPGTAYRLGTAAAWLPEFAETLATAGYTLAQERATPGVIDITLVADERRAWRRATYVQGDGAASSHVARAVDRHLIVTPAGCQRWRVGGPGLQQAQWVAEIWRKSLTDVLAVMGTTADALTREDDHALPVNVALPDRRIETEMIKRDPDGNLLKVVTIESTPPKAKGN